jgi:hypothetical protein
MKRFVYGSVAAANAATEISLANFSSPLCTVAAVRAPEGAPPDGLHKPLG